MAVRLVQRPGLPQADDAVAGLPPAAQVFVQLVEGIPQVLGCLKGADGRYRWANIGFAERLGRRPEALVGCTVTDLFPTGFARSYAEQDDAVLATGRPLQRHVELIVRSDGGIGWFVTSKSQVPDAQGRPWGVAALSVDLRAHFDSGHAGLAAAIDRVRSDVGHRWRVAELAEIAGLSPKQFERMARRTLGLGPQRLVQRLRIEHAVQAITSTGRPLGDIAAECGFYDQSSFTKQFRAVLGVTPGAYRRAQTQ